jgi:hypothetical protein
VYVVDDTGLCSSCRLGSTAWVSLPFTGLNDSWGLAAETAGNVYVAGYSNHQVLKLAAGSTTPTTARGCMRCRICRRRRLYP